MTCADYVEEVFNIKLFNFQKENVNKLYQQFKENPNLTFTIPRTRGISNLDWCILAAVKEIAAAGERSEA